MTTIRIIKGISSGWLVEAQQSQEQQDGDAGCERCACSRSLGRWIKLGASYRGTHSGVRESVGRAAAADFFGHDAAALNRSLERTEGPIVLVAHAYAGAVIALAQPQRVKALVYITALAPDEGEKVADVFYRLNWQYTQGVPDPAMVAPDGQNLDNFYLLVPVRMRCTRSSRRLQEQRRAVCAIPGIFPYAQAAAIGGVGQERPVLRAARCGSVQARQSSCRRPLSRHRPLRPGNACKRDRRKHPRFPAVIVIATRIHGFSQVAAINIRS